MVPQPIAAEAQPGEAEHRRLPEPAGAGAVDAVAGVAAHVEQVGARRAQEVLVGGSRLADAAGHDRADARPEARAVLVIGARAVVVVVGPHLLGA